PWARPEAEAFVQAYRRFINRCRETGAEFYFVWSPRGDNGLDRYFPGRDYVDLVGLSIYAMNDYDLLNYGRIRSFRENLAEKYDRIRRFDQPVMIAELGVDGPPAHRRAWLAAGIARLGDFPLLRHLVYFNQMDSHDAWGPRYA